MVGYLPDFKRGRIRSLYEYCRQKTCFSAIVSRRSVGERTTVTPGHDFCCNVLHSSLLLSQFSSRGDILPRLSFIAWQQNENERDNTLLWVLSRPGIGSACARSVDVSYCIYAM